MLNYLSKLCVGLMTERVLDVSVQQHAVLVQNLLADLALDEGADRVRVEGDDDPHQGRQNLKVKWRLDLDC